MDKREFWTAFMNFCSAAITGAIAIYNYLTKGNPIGIAVCTGVSIITFGLGIISVHLD